MSKVLVLYYSAYGHIEKMAEAVAEGALAVPGTEVTPSVFPSWCRRRSPREAYFAHRHGGTRKARRLPLR